MNMNEALHIMKLNQDDLILLDSVKLKKKYHQCALLYHPDKGGSNEEFKKLQEAYDYLNVIIEFHNYKKENTNIYDKIQKYIFKYINSISLAYIDECDNKQIKNMEKILEFYKSKIPTNIYDKIKNMLKPYNNNDNKTFVLKPSLDDLFENKIYRFNYKNEIFNVPLWHCELYYDTNTNEEICIKCCPELNPYIDIDSENNIQIFLFEEAATIFKNQYVDVKITEKISYKIYASDISFLPSQTIILKNKGISKISNLNTYDTKNISDIIVILNIR